MGRVGQAITGLAVYSSRLTGARDLSTCNTIAKTQFPQGAVGACGMAGADSHDNVDLMFRAFSDQTRLRILCLLLGGELCVGDIVAILQVPQPRVSRHLSYLKKAQLVHSRKAGLWSYYSLAPARTKFQMKLFECLEDCFGEVPEIRGDRRRATQIKKSGGCCPQ